MSVDRARLKKVLAEAKKRVEVKGALNYDELLFGPQRDFVADKNHLVAAWCSRRAGKSWGVCLKMLKTAHKYPGCTVLYITNNRRQAKRVLWDLVLLPMLRTLGVPYHPNQNELCITLNNGSRILLGGANDAQEIETYRGLKSPLIVLDEAQTFRSFLETMIEEVLDPCTIDYDGQIYMTGTPNAACFGFFHDVCKATRKGWSLHHWTIHQNPHIPNAAFFLARKRDQQGIRPNDPKFLREWEGQWIRDSEGLVFSLEDHHILADLPSFPDMSHVLGMDFGYTDETAFVTLGFSVASGKMCVVESESQSGMTPSDVAEKVQKLDARYHYEAMVGDTGGLGKGYAEEMIQRWGLPIEAAEKRDKMAAIELMNGDLRKGLISIYEPANQLLIQDARLLQWNYDKVDAAKHGGRTDRLKLEIDDRTPDHLTDAWLYGYRKCRHYLFSEELPGLEVGSQAWLEAQEEAMWEDQTPKGLWSLEQEELAID